MADFTSVDDFSNGDDPTGFFDNSSTGIDPTASDTPPADPGTSVDTGFVDGDQGAISDSGTIENFQSSDPAPTEAPPDANSGLEFDDGSSYDDATQIYTDADGNEHTVTGGSPDGTVLQFDDGSVLDKNSGTMYANMDDFLNSDESGANASATSDGGRGSSKGNPSFGGGPSSGGGGGKSGGGSGGNNQQNAQANQIGKALAGLGSSLAALLTGGAKPVPARNKVTGQKTNQILPVAPKGGLNGGGTTLLVVGLVILGFLALSGGE